MPDVILLIIVVFAVIKGFRRGLIVGIFSFLAILIGLAAALKLSAMMASYLGSHVEVAQRWLPALSFALVFLGVVLLVRLGANLLQKAVEVAMMGWVNRLGGILFYLLMYLIVYSIMLFYADQLHLLHRENAEESISYRFILPLGPWFIDGFGVILPFFRDMFTQLQEFFGGVADAKSATPV